jgi:hypothetical protein
MNLHDIIRDSIKYSAYYPGCGDDFGLMFKLPIPRCVVYCDWGGRVDESGKQELYCGHENSFWNFVPEGWTLDTSIGINGIADITDPFLDLFGENDFITTTWNSKENINKKVLQAQYRKGSMRKKAIFCLGFEGIDLYKKLYPNAGKCRIFIHKQGIGTKDSRFTDWGTELTTAFEKSQPDLLYDWEWEGGWLDLPPQLKAKFLKESVKGIIPGYTNHQDNRVAEAEYEIDHRPRIKLSPPR